MSERDNLKARCDVTLGFPHDGDMDLAVRLGEIADFVADRGWSDAMYLADPMRAELEQKTTEYLGAEAALWFPTGTMAQGVAARIHAGARGHDTLLLHPSSHLELHEEHGYREAHGLKAALTGDWRAAMSARDIEACEADLAAVFLELPQRHAGGVLPSRDGLEAIKAVCKARGVPLHIDGARLWTCVAAYDGQTLADICDGTDSIYVSFYKDIGALGGAALAGSAAFIEDAKIWRHRLGGLQIRGFPYIADALRLLPERMARMPAYIERAGQLAAAIGRASGFEIEPAEPRTNMFHIRLPMNEKQVQGARDHAARETGVWLANRFWDYEGDHMRSAEISVGERIMAIEPGRIVKAFKAMAEFGE